MPQTRGNKSLKPVFQGKSERALSGGDGPCCCHSYSLANTIQSTLPELINMSYLEKSVQEGKYSPFTIFSQWLLAFSTEQMEKNPNHIRHYNIFLRYVADLNIHEFCGLSCSQTCLNCKTRGLSRFISSSPFERFLLLQRGGMPDVSGQTVKAARILRSVDRIHMHGAEQSDKACHIFNLPDLRV